MPIYEYYCKNNNKLYSFFARSTAYADVTPRCPDNAKYTLERVVSSFAITGNAKEESEDFPADLDEGKMEAAFGALEREMHGIDADNPDPKQLAQFMRKFTDMTGQKLPEVFQEMMSRLEKGEDPETLEAEYGDAIDDESVFNSIQKTLSAVKKQPVRDPELYDMREYV